MRLLLIRHAQSANNALPEHLRVEDPALTALGHRQAQALAVWLSTCSVNVLVASPFRRALETVEYLRRELVVVPRCGPICTSKEVATPDTIPSTIKGAPG